VNLSSLIADIWANTDKVTGLILVPMVGFMLRRLDHLELRVTKLEVLVVGTLRPEDVKAYAGSPGNRR
jgi:hypothetical protein